MSSPSACSDKSEESNSPKTKKIWGREDLIEAMKPSSEELLFRENKSKNTNAQENLKSFTCTTCNRNLKLNLDTTDRVQTHPCLGVLMCQNCCNYYEDGEFSLDSEGEDKYCRWCGEGGTIFGCSRCICGFCVSCIKKHFGNEYLKKVKKDDDWLCFFCQPKPLWEKRYICSVAMQLSKSKNNEIPSQSAQIKNGKKGFQNQEKDLKNQKRHPTPLFSKISLESDSDSSTDFKSWSFKSDEKSRGKRRCYSSSSDEAEVKSPEKKKKKSKHSENKDEGASQNNEQRKQLVIEKLQRILKLSGYQMSFGMNWSSKMLKKLTDPKEKPTSESLKKECEKIKLFLSALSSYLTEFYNSVDSVEKSLSLSLLRGGSRESNNFCQLGTEPMGFSGVMQFLNFVTNQVKTFMKKGLSLADILEAEIYDDNKFIGIKKKASSNISNGDSGNNSFQQDKVNLETHENASQSSQAEKEESQNEGFSELMILDQESQSQNGDGEGDGDGDVTDMNSSGASSENLKSSSSSKEDILKILEILENA